MPFQNSHWQSTCESVPKTCVTSIGALLSCFLSLSGKFLLIMSPLVLGEFLGEFFNIECRWQVSCSRLWEFETPNSDAIISKTEKFSLNFLFHFWNVHQILNSLKKRMIVIVNVFRKLETLKSLVRPLSKKRRLRTRFDSQHLKVFQILENSPWERFDHVFHHFQGSWFGISLP